PLGRQNGREIVAPSHPDQQRFSMEMPEAFADWEGCLFFPVISSSDAASLGGVSRLRSLSELIINPDAPFLVENQQVRTRSNRLSANPVIDQPTERGKIVMCMRRFSGRKNTFRIRVSLMQHPRAGYKIRVAVLD